MEPTLSTREGAPDSGRRFAFLLFAAALLLYAPGIFWGLPHATAPDRIFPWGSDELAPLGPLAQVYHIVFHGGAAFDPRYPLLPYAIQALFIAPSLAWLRLTGGLDRFEVTYPYGLEDPASALALMTLFARLSSLLMMAAVPVVAWYTARKLWDARTAAFAAVCVLLLYPSFYYARTSNVDAGSVLWTSLGVLVFASVLRDGLTERRAALLGWFAALAIATKDQSYAVFLTLGVAVAVLHARAAAANGWRQVLVPLGVGLLTSIGVYAVASGIVFHPSAFMRHIEFILFHPGGTSGQSYFSTPATLAGYLQLAGRFLALLVDCLGWPMSLAAAGGLIVTARKSPRTLLIALPVLAILIGIIMPVRFIRIRFLLSAAYVLALYAGASLGALAVWRGRTRVAWAAFVVIAAWSLLRAADLTWQMQNDSRHQLESWLRDNARAGDRVGYYGAPLKLPPLALGVISQPGPFADGSAAPDTWPEFIVIIPQQVFELEHEWNLSDEHYSQLKSGVWPYVPWLAVQGSRLFDERPIHWVNPPVRLFVRQDIESRVSGEPRLELD
jgi:hypothetical protein